MKRRRILLFGVVALLCAAALLAIAILLVGRFGETERRVMATTLLLAGYGILSLPGVVLLDQGRRRRLAECAVMLPGAAAALALVSVWGFSDVDAVGKSVGSATILALAAAQAAALAGRRTSRDPPLVQRLFTASCVTAAAAAGAAVTLVWAQPSGSFYARLVGVLVVLDLLFVALQPLLVRAGATGGGRGTRAASRAGRAGCSPSRPASSGIRRPAPPVRDGRIARRSGASSGRR